MLLLHQLIEKECVEQLDAEAAAATVSTSAADEPFWALIIKNLSECLEFVRKALAIIDENDLIDERSSTVSHAMMGSMTCQQVMLKENNEKRSNRQ